MHYVKHIDLRTMHNPRSYNNASHCQANGCVKSTREGKPYCPEHVEKHPYVHKLVTELNAHRTEVKTVEQKGRTGVRPDSLMVQELLLHLRTNGTRTIDRLSREFQLPSEVIESYAEFLVRKKMVLMGQTKRGTRTVSLKVA